MDRYFIVIFFNLFISCFGMPLALQASAAPPAATHFDILGLLQTIDGQIVSLRESNISKAYYAYTHKDFRQNTSLDSFKTFVNGYEPLNKNTSIRLTQIAFKENVGLYEGIISSKNGEQIIIHYQLSKESGKWKILGIKLSSYICKK